MELLRGLWVCYCTRKDCRACLLKSALLLLHSGCPGSKMFPYTVYTPYIMTLTSFSHFPIPCLEY